MIIIIINNNNHIITYEVIIVQHVVVLVLVTVYIIHYGFSLFDLVRTTLIIVRRSVAPRTTLCTEPVYRSQITGIDIKIY